MITLRGWVVTHTDDHDDQESLERSVGKCFAKSPQRAWKNFLALCGGEKKEWNSRGYVARPVSIRVAFIAKFK